MQNVLPAWAGLGLRQRAIVIGAAVAVFVAVLALARMASAPAQALLYSGLDPAAAGEVVAALEQRGVAYTVRGEAIFVDADQRDSLRMQLAAEGLPAVGGAGYELLDRLSGFGTTAQMFDAAYLRAKEGELARTIAASPAVRAARVHIAAPPPAPFRRETRPTASVTVTTRSGGLTADQARAIRHMVAASVAGLVPADVAVIDSALGLVPDDAAPTPGSAGQDRAEALRSNVERLMAARVGAGRALVEVSVDVVTERESITERRLDPQGRVAIATDTEERTESSQGTAPGVTVASNLPEGDAGKGGESRSNAATTRERVNFEVSEVARALERPPGAIRRLTVAVLVDGTTDAAGTWSPRSEAELADLRDLVAAAVGFDAARGDVITIKSMQFVRPADDLAGEAPGFLAGLDAMRLIQMAVIAAVALLLGLFVLRPMVTGARRGTNDGLAPALPSPSLAPVPVLEGEIDDGAGPRPEAAARGPADPPAADAAVERLRRLIAERQTETVEILRSWMDEREDRR